MEELIRTNNVVTLSFVGTLLKEAGIVYFIADENMSVLDGSIGALSRRLLVDAERIVEARKLVEAAGLADELRQTGAKRTMARTIQRRLLHRTQSMLFITAAFIWCSRKARGIAPAWMPCCWPHWCRMTPPADWRIWAPGQGRQDLRWQTVLPICVLR